MLTVDGTSLSSEFGDGRPHSLGTVPQKRFYEYRDFLGTQTVTFFLTRPIGSA
jgi:hypothetical protein